MRLTMEKVYKKEYGLKGWQKLKPGAKRTIRMLDSVPRLPLHPRRLRKK